MKIPFDIKYRPQIESGEYKVITGDDRPVRIISWDKKVFGGRFEIVGLVPTPQGNTESVQLYCPDGTLIASTWNEKYKLFIITPKPELTEFEEAIAQYLDGKGLIVDAHIQEDAIKTIAAKLLELARKELIEEQLTFNHSKKEDPESVYTFKCGVEYGRAEALKDLPRWKNIGRGRNYSLDTEFIINGRYLEMTDSLNDVYEVALSELEKLPKDK